MMNDQWILIAGFFYQYRCDSGDKIDEPTVPNEPELKEKCYVFSWIEEDKKELIEKTVRTTVIIKLFFRVI